LALDGRPRRLFCGAGEGSSSSLAAEKMSSSSSLKSAAWRDAWKHTFDDSDQANVEKGERNTCLATTIRQTQDRERLGARAGDLEIRAVVLVLILVRVLVHVLEAWEDGLVVPVALVDVRQLVVYVLVRILLVLVRRRDILPPVQIRRGGLLFHVLLFHRAHTRASALRVCALLQIFEQRAPRAPLLHLVEVGGAVPQQAPHRGGDLHWRATPPGLTLLRLEPLVLDILGDHVVERALARLVVHPAAGLHHVPLRPGRRVLRVVVHARAPRPAALVLRRGVEGAQRGRQEFAWDVVERRRPRVLNLQPGRRASRQRPARARCSKRGEAAGTRWRRLHSQGLDGVVCTLKTKDTASPAHPPTAARGGDGRAARSAGVPSPRPPWRPPSRAGARPPWQPARPPAPASSRSSYPWEPVAARRVSDPHHAPRSPHHRPSKRQHLHGRRVRRVRERATSELTNLVPSLSWSFWYLTTLEDCIM